MPIAAFDPALLHRPRAEIEAVQQQQFNETMDLVCKGHPHYRALIGRLGLQRADFEGVADLARLPITSKQALMDDPQAFQLQVTDGPPEMRVVWDTMYTTGTSTGTPTPFVSTAYDYYAVIAMYRRILSMRGVRGDDLIANLCPLTVYPHGAYHRVSAAGAALKIPVVNLVPGRPSHCLGVFRYRTPAQRLSGSGSTCTSCSNVSDAVEVRKCPHSCVEFGSSGVPTA